MTITNFKENINKVINNINDKSFLEAVYTIVAKKAKKLHSELTPAMKHELDTRKDSHKKGKSKSSSWQNVKKAALKNEIMTATMDITAIRRQLHNYLEVVEDKKVKAIYTMLESAIKESSVTYTSELKASLDERYADYKNGKAKTIAGAASRKRIQKILKGNYK